MGYLLSFGVATGSNRIAYDFTCGRDKRTAISLQNTSTHAVRAGLRHVNFATKAHEIINLHAIFESRLTAVRSQT